VAQTGGEADTLDENLVDVETDKVVLELPCPANGVLTQILKRDGSIVVAGEVIALVDTEAMASAESRKRRFPNPLPFPVLRRVRRRPGVRQRVTNSLLGFSICNFAYFFITAGAVVIWSIKIKTANSKIPQRQEYFTPAGFFSPCPCILFF